MYLHPVKRLRKQNDLTVAELAELTGLSTATIRAIENGTSDYRTHEGVASLLADIFGCRVSELFAPGELSHRGRPPLTGGSIRITTTVVEYNVCPVHFIVLPTSGICDECL